MAINDLIKVGLAIAEDSPINAGEMVNLIESKVTSLAKHPDIGRVGRVSDEWLEAACAVLSSVLGFR